MKKLVVITMFICMVCTGVVYARWSNQISIHTDVSTGMLSYKVAGDTLEVSWSDGTGQWAQMEHIGILCEQDNSLTVDVGEMDGLTADNLGMELKIRYQIIPDEGNTIEDIASMEEESKLVMEPDEVRLCDITGEEVLQELKVYAPILNWEGTTTVEEVNEQIWVTHLYHLTNESQIAYQTACQTPVKRLEGMTEDAVLKLHYTFTISSGISQEGVE